MRQRSVLVLNSLTQILSRVFTVGVRFFIVPFAIGVLGRTQYGVWVVVGQIFAYTRILEAGLRGAVVRHVAVGLARGDQDLVDRHVDTASAYFLIVCLIMTVLTGVLAVFFPNLFHVKQEYAWAARVMVLISGFTLALSVAQYAHAAILSGLQREDIVSGSQVVVDVLNLVLVFALLKRFDIGGGLVVLAAVSGGLTLLGTTARSFVARRLCKTARWRPWRMDRTLIWDMATFGINTVIYMMSLSAAAQLAQIVIGAAVSTAAATDFRVAMELIIGVHTFVIATTIGVKAAAGRYDGENNRAMLRLLLVRSTRYAGMVTLAGVLGLVVFCHPFMRLWQGRNYPGEDGAAKLASVAGTCRILAVGFGVFWLMMPAFNVVNGMGRHRFPAAMSLISGILSMLLVLLAVGAGYASPETLALAVVLPAIPTCGIAILVYCCREVGQPISAFVREGLAAPLLGLLPAVFTGLVLNYVAPAQSWTSLIVQIACCAIASAPFLWMLVLKDDRSQLLGSLMLRIRRRKDA